MTHDLKCRDLAIYFLKDQPNHTENDVTRLADRIQTEIEAFLWRRFPPSPTPALDALLGPPKE